MNPEDIQIEIDELEDEMKWYHREMLDHLRNEERDEKELEELINERNKTWRKRNEMRQKLRGLVN